MPEGISTAKRLRPSPSIIISIFALVIAMSSGAYAAVTIAEKNSVVSKSIKNGQVKSRDLAKNSVNAKKIKDGQVGSADITDLGIGTSDFADASVTTGKLADASVTTGKLADASVTTGKLANNAVTNAKLADNAVTSAKIADSTITSADVLDDSLGEADLGPGSVTASELGTITQRSATSAAIAAGANGSVTASCLAGETVISGGNDGFFDLFVVASRVSGNGWAVFVHNDSGGNRTVTAHAYCLAP